MLSVPEILALPMLVELKDREVIGFGDESERLKIFECVVDFSSLPGDNFRS